METSTSNGVDIDNGRRLQRRAAASRTTRGSTVVSTTKGMKRKSSEEEGKPNVDGASEDDDDDEEEEEEEVDDQVEEQDDSVDIPETSMERSTSGGRSGSTDMQSMVKGAMVRIIRTTDVEQRVPHTIGKIGLIAEVPQHPNTWFKVRIRDGDVVYKYRPSALQLVDDEKMNGDDESMISAAIINSTGKEQEIVEDDDDEEEEEDLELDVDTRVRVQLGSLSRRERDLKKYQSKLGVIIANESDGFKVQLDSEDIITIKRKHLIAAPDAPREEEEEADEEEDDEDADEDNQTTESNQGEGQLLSDLDPDMWIDRKCRINVGKFKNRHGRVLRSGNGWVQLRLETSNENTAKRAYELTLMEDMDTIKSLYKATQATSATKKRDRQGEGVDVDGGDDEDDEEDEEDEEDNGASNNSSLAEHMDDSQSDEHGGKRSRRVSTRGNYGVSWIDRKVLLPNRKGFGIVKKADRETCTVELTTSKVFKVFKKKDLELVEEDVQKNGNRAARAGNRNTNNSMRVKDGFELPEGKVLMGISASRYSQFQDQVKKFIMRRREKFKKRPNLQGFKSELEFYSPSNPQWDREHPKMTHLIIVPQCEICGFEKESTNSDCWNDKCPRSINFDVDAFDASDADAFARSPVIPFISEAITSTICLRPLVDEAPPRKRKRKQIPLPRTQTNVNRSIDAVMDGETPPPQSSIELQNSRNADDTKLQFDQVAPMDSMEGTTRNLDATSKVADSTSTLELVKSEVVSTMTHSSLCESQVASPPFRPQYESVFSR